ncbi:TWiK family of potassium channels protein 7-like isoform X2 [Lytechinus variegatus]|nr:TWiK family of potassium channels protein 7-like isoform X2 [Lytechinus variegatus]
MLQPEMSNMPMSAMSREMTTRGSGRLQRVRENENEDIAEIKKGHSVPEIVPRVVRAVVPHLALMAVFFLYLAFGAWVFFMLENDCSMKCQMELQEAKMKMMDIAANRTLCNPSGSTALPPQDARGRMTSPSGGDGNDSVAPSESSEVCDDIIMEEMDEHFDVVMKKMVRSGMTVGKMDSILVGRTWNLTSAMLFSMTTITTIGYGDIAPETTGGRVFCIFYATFGIPLALLFLANIGNLMARLTLKICRATHHCLFVRHKIGASCRGCRGSSKNHPESSSQRKIVNGEVEIPLEDVDLPPPYDSTRRRDEKGSTEKTLDVNTNEHAIMRSVSIATERPTSHPRGVTKQPSADACQVSTLPPCSCEPNKCQCHHKPDVLEEVPLLVVLVILIVYMCGGAAWMASSEGWDFGTGIYFMFITLTTIGFGDVLPMKHYADDVFIPCVFFTLFGLAIMSMCIALVQVKILRCYQVVKTKFGLC